MTIPHQKPDSRSLYRAIAQDHLQKLLAQGLTCQQAEDKIEALPWHLITPWAYVGTADSFDRHTEIMNMLQERAKTLGLASTEAHSHVL